MRNFLSKSGKMFACYGRKRYAIDPSIVTSLTPFKAHLLSVSGTPAILRDTGADLQTKWRKATWNLLQCSTVILSKKIIFTQYIPQVCILHWKEAKGLLTLHSAVKFSFCRLFVGMYFVGALRCCFITCTYQEFLINLLFFQSTVHFQPAHKRSAVGIWRKDKREPGCAHIMHKLI